MIDDAPPGHADALLLTLRELEKQLPSDGVRSSPAALAALLADDFIEFGRSGRVYDKRRTIKLMSEEMPGRVRAKRTAGDFRYSRLADTVALLTYRSTRRVADNVEFHTLRSSIWVWAEGRWQMSFHQATPTDAAP